jgi:hypothetical protein
MLKTLHVFTPELSRSDVRCQCSELADDCRYFGAYHTQVQWFTPSPEPPTIALHIGPVAWGNISV